MIAGSVRKAARNGRKRAQPAITRAQSVPGARWAASAVAGDGPVAEAVRALLHGIVLVGRS